ncbi:O-antigen ligase family protein [Carnobacterium maltaromaticum]|uniref:O-antigen ligase family protein n=1 Tax=Carnobacterium maltaromaticum TaxID=2751 RepID=UPI0011460BBC|nr:hypothetical protein [Carnobacterium maltaromaticum]
MTTVLILLGFSSTYSVFQYFYGFSTTGTILLYLLYPFTLYTLGYIVTAGKYKKMYQYFTVIILSFTLFGFLSVLNTILTYGTMGSAISAFGGRRLVMNLWDNSFISATGVNTTLSFGLAMLPIIQIKEEKLKNSNLIRAIALFCFLAATYSVIQLGNRTGFVIIILTFLTTIMLTKKTSVKKITGIFSIVLSILFLKYLFDNNFLGLRSSWENTILFTRLQSADLGSDPRFLNWSLAFKGLFENPMGGKMTHIPIEYVHNIWLDTAYEGGVIPFGFLLVLTIIAIKEVVRFRKYEHPTMLKGIVITLFVAFIATFMVEPVIQGWFTYFNIFCFILGMVQRQNVEYVNTSPKLVTEAPESQSRTRRKIVW